MNDIRDVTDIMRNTGRGDDGSAAMMYARGARFPARDRARLVCARRVLQHLARALGWKVGGEA